MLRSFIYRLLEPRHFWRGVNFSELSELYVSNMLRSLAISLLMVFVPFFLYQQGYKIAAIFSVFGCYFAARTVADIVAGFTVARIGPKHTMIISCLLQIVSSTLFLTVPSHHWPVWLLGAPWGAAASFFFIAYHVAFSKIKHSAHSGKEIGYMSIMEKVGGVVGPLIGGLVGSIFGAQFIFLMATAVLLASLWPLFQTKEPVTIHQKLRLKAFPTYKVKRDIAAYVGLGIENSLCLNLWPLYLSLFALGSSVYAKLGVLSSVAILTSISSAYFIGRLIDVKNARLVLRLAATVNALVYVFRPFVGGLAAAFATNVVNEAVTTGYRMPFTKGMYTAADDLPGFRIVYIMSMEAIASIAKATAWFMLAIGAGLLSGRTVITVGFVLAGSGSLLIMVEKFKALNPKKHILGLSV